MTSTSVFFIYYYNVENLQFYMMKQNRNIIHDIKNLLLFFGFVFLFKSMRQSSLINACTLELKLEFTVMVKSAHWSNEYFFYMKQTEAYPVTHMKHSGQVLPKTTARYSR